VCETTIVRDAWARNQPLAVYGFIYGIQDGLLHDLQTTVRNSSETTVQYEAALTQLGRQSGHRRGT
jgi:carbonic anhydrase